MPEETLAKGKVVLATGSFLAKYEGKPSDESLLRRVRGLVVPARRGPSQAAPVQELAINSHTIDMTGRGF